jgi:hypothetical protein
MEEGKEDIPWSVMASVLVVARFCVLSPELQIADSWYEWRNVLWGLKT